jgi:hypothetical protein
LLENSLIFVLRYLKKLCPAQYLLWSYFIWYITISIFYFDSNPEIWLSAFGISIIVGIALVLSANCWPLDFKKLDYKQTLRLFIIPFCVSSYASLIKGKAFIFIFPADLKTSGLALFAITVFVGLSLIIKKLA